MVFPDFTGLLFSDWRCFGGKAWRKKIPERSEDDFFPANRPEGLPCAKQRNPIPLPSKTEKHRPDLQPKKRRMQTFNRSASFSSVARSIVFAICRTCKSGKYRPLSLLPVSSPHRGMLLGRVVPALYVPA